MATMLRKLFLPTSLVILCSICRQNRSSVELDEGKGYILTLTFRILGVAKMNQSTFHSKSFFFLVLLFLMVTMYVSLFEFETILSTKGNVLSIKPVEMRKLCQKNIFEQVLLVLIFHYPFYATLPLIKSNYEGAFPHIVVCGSQNSSLHKIMVVDHYKGYFGYECVGKAIRLHPGFRGYLYLNDDMIVNWWNFVRLDKDRIWLGAPLDTRKGFQVNSRPIPREWKNWRYPNVSENCEAAFREIQSKSDISSKVMAVHHRNTLNKTLCLKVWSDMFYIPGRLSDDFQTLSAIFFKNKVFLSIGVATSLTMLDLYEKWEKPFGIYLPDKYSGRKLNDNLIGWREYSKSITFIHPVKYKLSEENRRRLNETVIAQSKNRTNC